MILDKTKRMQFLPCRYWRATQVVAITVAALLLFATGAVAAWPEAQWVSVDLYDNDVPLIAVDPAGNPNVVWRGSDGSNGHVYYAENNGSGWNPDPVSSGVSTSNWYPHMALDSAGNPNIVWSGWVSSVEQIYYAENTGSGWTPQKVSLGTSTANEDPQIALDSAGNPHVVWYGTEGSSKQIYYAENTGGAWPIPQKISTGAAPNNYFPRLALDPDGNPNVVWYGIDGSNFNVYYAESDGGPWTPQMVSTGTNNRNPQIAIDGAGHPNVVWWGWDGSTAQIYYAENAGSGWTPQMVSTTSTGNISPQIALDSEGNPNVVWCGSDGSTNHIYYAENTGSGWAPQLISATSTDNEVPQIVLDPGGNPRVVWGGSSGGSNTMACYAENNGGAWTSQVLPSGISTDVRNPQLALSSTGNPNVVWWGPDNVHDFEHIFYSAPTIPTVTTTAPGGVTSTSAVSGGNVTDDGGAPVTERGVCWSTSPNPIISGEHTVDGNGIGTFSSDIPALNPGTLYYVRAYATNSAGTGYGDQKSFTTLYQAETSYLAEGTNAWGFSTYITLENPYQLALHAKLTYMDPSGPTAGKGILKSRTLVLPPASQTTVSSMSDIGEIDFATKVECTEGYGIGIDRTMFWTGKGAACPGYHSSVASGSLSNTWYMPEGSSNWGFETWTCAFNPNADPANVTLTYNTQDGPVTVHKTIPPHARATWPMVDDVGAADASIQIESDQPLVAERSMYRDDHREGSCSIGATDPTLTFFLAEGATGYDADFVTYVLVQNPGTETNKVSITYNTGSGPVPGPAFEMAPGSRKTVRVNDTLPLNTDFSTTVQGTESLVAERAMYWDAGSGEAFHASIGLSIPHVFFMLPDGQTGNGFETWTVVSNIYQEEVEVRVTYLPQDGKGEPVSFTAKIPPLSRRSFNMADKVPSGRAAAMVESLGEGEPDPILVERAMYMNQKGAGTSTIGSCG